MRKINLFSRHLAPGIKYLLVIGCLINSVSTTVIAQDSSKILDVAQLRFQHALNEFGEISWVDDDHPKDSLPFLQYRKNLLGKFQVRIPDRVLEKTLVLKFTLSNSADTVRKVFFTPGFYTRNIDMFVADPRNISQTFTRIHDSVSKADRFQGARTLYINPRDTIMYFARFKMLRTNSNNFLARIVEEDFIPAWLNARKIWDHSQDSLTYVVTGIMLLMIFYSLAVYLQSRSREFLYYSAYAFCTGFLLYLKAFNNHEYSHFNFLFEEYLDFMIMGIGIFFYFIFVRTFLNTRQNHAFLHRIFKVSEVLLLSLLGIFSFIYFFSGRYLILNLMENYIIKFSLLVIGIIFIIYSIRKRNKLLNYLAAGNISLVLFSLISLAVMLYKPRIIPNDASNILNRSLFYYEVGLVLELMFFLAGLAYKNKIELIEQVQEKERIRRENERQEFEKQMAVMAAQQDERNRISADMHDELGSGVTAIRLMSEIVKSKMKDSSYPEIEKISNFANDLLGKMNTIIWTMKSSNDSLESLAAYIRAHAIEFFDSTPIDCTVHVSIQHNAEITGEKRRNIFLSIKESLNNVMKHAHATTVRIDIIANDGQLAITIKDNGKGIDKENLRRFGNGLSNMKKRMQSVNGEFLIETDGGTILTFLIPVSSSALAPVEEPV